MNDIYDEMDSDKLAELILDDTPKYTKTLLAIVFGKYVPERSFEQLEAEQTDYTQLEMMKRMTLVEFSAGFEKALDEESELSKHHEIRPFGVYTVVPRLMNGNIDLAVCIPIRKNIRKLMCLPDEEDKIWIDRNNTIWKLNDLECNKLVTSLSSTIRIMDNLDIVISSPSDLSMYAMERSNLFDAKAYDDDQKEEKHLTKFNESQRLTISSAKYLRDGFFVIQGPP